MFSICTFERNEKESNLHIHLALSFSFENKKTPCEIMESLAPVLNQLYNINNAYDVLENVNDPLFNLKIHKGQCSLIRYCSKNWIVGDKVIFIYIRNNKMKGIVLSSCVSPSELNLFENEEEEIKGTTINDKFFNWLHNQTITYQRYPMCIFNESKYQLPIIFQKALINKPNKKMAEFKAIAALIPNPPRRNLYSKLLSLCTFDRKEPSNYINLLKFHNINLNPFRKCFQDTIKCVPGQKQRVFYCQGISNSGKSTMFDWLIEICKVFSFSSSTRGDFRWMGLPDCDACILNELNNQTNRSDILQLFGGEKMRINIKYSDAIEYDTSQIPCFASSNEPLNWEKKLNTWDNAVLNRCHLIQFKRVLPNADPSKRDPPLDILNWMMDNPDRIHNIQNLDVVDGVNLEELLEEKYFKYD